MAAQSSEALGFGSQWEVERTHIGKGRVSEIDVIETPKRLLPIEVKASTRVSVSDTQRLEAFMDETMMSRTADYCSTQEKRPILSRAAFRQFRGSVCAELGD